MNKKQDVASLTMTFLFGAAILARSFVIAMANRISPIQHLKMSAALDGLSWIPIAVVVVLLLLVLFKGSSEGLNFLTGLWASFWSGGIIALVGFSAQTLTEGRGSAFRVTFGIGIYLMLLACYGIIIKCNLHVRSAWKRNLTTFLGVGIIAVLFASGWMDRMSIMIEYHNRSAKFLSALQGHLKLSLAVILASTVFGIPLGYFCYRSKAVNLIAMVFLNIVRSIPSIGLIIVMVTPLSLLRSIPFFKRLGVGAFGFTPVFCALFLYALFQIVNSLSGALKTIEPDLLKAAKAMGMTEWTIMRRVQIPMVLPVLVSGIRVAMISTFTGASLGALVGFNGLGTFIEMGNNGAIALDMILLGAVPIMIMIFVADFAFRKLGGWLECRITGGSVVENRMKEMQLI